MKQGKTITELAAEIHRQQITKRDFLADSRKLHMDPVHNNLEIALDVTTPNNQRGICEQFPVSRNAHHQIADWTGIPQKYYDRLPANLRAHNVNHWLQTDPGQRMVRTLDGDVRAFVSGRYRCLDNFDLAEAVLPILADVPGMEIVSSELTSNRMYVKALFPRITADVGVGDPVQSGVVISNSETGRGSLRVEPLIYRLVCLNGMINGYSQKCYHVGKAGGEDDQAQEIYRDETVEADDRAFWMKVQDTVRASVDQAKFLIIVDQMRATKNIKIETDPVTVIERVQKKFALNDKEGKSVLTHLIAGGDLSGYGLLNAITRTAHDQEDYERATAFERMGGRVLELAPTEWHELSAAA